MLSKRTFTYPASPETKIIEEENRLDVATVLLAATERVTELKCVLPFLLTIQ